MKTGTAFAAILLGIASFPLLAQRPPPTSQPGGSTVQQNSPAGQHASPDPSASPAGSDSPSSPVAQMSPVSGALVGSLDSKTAKNGDPVVIQTETTASTADGKNIPKGSRLVGHVLAVQPSGGTQNSQVALEFDHLELSGGQSIPVHLQIETIGATKDTASANTPKAGTSPNHTDSASASADEPAGGSKASTAPQGTDGASQANTAEKSNPAAGTVVAKSGKIDIRTTSIPGVLLANNVAGQQDPRMAQASSILLGAKQEIQLASGTKMILGISAPSGGTQ